MLLGREGRDDGDLPADIFLLSIKFYYVPLTAMLKIILKKKITHSHSRTKEKEESHHCLKISFKRGPGAWKDGSVIESVHYLSLSPDTHPHGAAHNHMGSSAAGGPLSGL